MILILITFYICDEFLKTWSVNVKKIIFKFMTFESSEKNYCGILVFLHLNDTYYIILTKLP